MNFLDIKNYRETPKGVAVIHYDNKGYARLKYFATKEAMWERLKRDACKASVRDRQGFDRLAYRAVLAETIKAILSNGGQLGYVASLYCCDTGRHERSGSLPVTHPLEVDIYLEDIAENWGDGPGSASLEARY